MAWRNIVLKFIFTTRCIVPCRCLKILLVHTTTESCFSHAPIGQLGGYQPRSIPKGTKWRLAEQVLVLFSELKCLFAKDA